MAGQHLSTRLHTHQAPFLAVVLVVVVLVSAPLLCGWQALAQSLQASQSTAFDRVSASGQSSISGSASTLADSENGGLGSLPLSDVSEGINEDDSAFDPSEVLGIPCFLVLLRGQRLLLADREGSAKPYSFVYCALLERPG